MKLDTFTIAIIAVLFYFYLTRVAPEGLENVNDYKRDLAAKILNFMDTESKYGEYLQFLVDNKNRSYKLLDNEVFTQFRLLKKKNILTIGDILMEMDDIN